MATRPARQPFSVMPRSGLPIRIHDITVALKIAAMAALLVVPQMRAMSSKAAAIVLPGLTPNQPSHRMKQPIVASERLWPGMGFTPPFSSYLPKRGPSTSTPASAAQPPTECTTVEPAKSQKPSVASHPPPQIQCPVTGYMKPTSTNEKAMNETYLMRSATAPETIVAAVPAKTSWKKNFAKNGRS